MSDFNSVDAFQAHSNESLIEHLLERYHARHRQQLPELIRLAEKVERVHADHPACPTGLAAHLRHMQSELESHMNKEEQVLFPMILRGLGAMAMGPISVMRAEHLEHEDAIAQLERLARGPELPGDACQTWRSLISGIAALKADLVEHMALENEVLFARFD